MEDSVGQASLDIELRSFFEILADRCEQVGSSLCVGLDPDPLRIPRYLGSGPEAIYKFCAEVIEATADLASAFKPNAAFFESIGVEGLHVLDQVLRLVPPEVPVILDVKRGDVGSTAKHYARAAFERMRVGAVTVNPYMGFDAVEPFMEFEGRAVYVLCLTSNRGALDFQLQEDLYLRVARRVSEWNAMGNLGMVVGATRPQFLSSILAIAPDVPLLIPGLGAQGGDLEQILEAAPGLPPHHLLFNVSRTILYAASDKSFGRQARVVARQYSKLIADTREKVARAG